MIRAFVVDDEPLLLKSIMSSIGKNPAFMVEGKAYDGEDALEQIVEKQPDVVFMDINIPLLDGLTVIERLQKRGVNPVFVIISGYKEFDYAKRAIGLGVMDYILKPVDPRKMAVLLAEIEKRIVGEQHVRQQEQFETIIHGKKSHALSDVALSEQFSGYRSFFCLYLCIGPYCTSKFNQFDFLGRQWNRGFVHEAIEPLLEKQQTYWIVGGEYRNEMIVIVGAKTLLHESCQQISEGLYAAICHCGLPVTLIASRQFPHPLEFRNVLLELKYEAMEKNRFAISSYCPYGDETRFASSIRAVLLPQENSQFVLLSSQRRHDQLKQQMKNLLHRLWEGRCSQKDLTHLLKNLIRTLSEERGQTWLTEEKIDELISNCSNYDMLYAQLCDMLDELYAQKEFAPPSDQSAARTVEDIERYLSANYSCQLSLQEIAEAFDISYSYLSSLFKKYKGISPNEYLTQKRLQKAKELLCMDPPHSIKDIAQSVGYLDPYYFSRIFKATTSMTPTQYRANWEPDSTENQKW